MSWSGAAAEGCEKVCKIESGKGLGADVYLPQPLGGPVGEAAFKWPHSESRG